MEEFLPLGQGFFYQTDVKMLQVAQTAVDHSRGFATGATGKISLLNERHFHAPHSRISSNGGAGDATTDYSQVELPLSHQFEIAFPGSVGKISGSDSFFTTKHVTMS